jgi:hypothetical protein
MGGDQSSNLLKVDSSINLGEIDKTVLREFFGHICKKKDKSGVYMDPVVFQHVSGYKSAIWNLYSNMSVNVTEDIKKMSKQFFEGYVRMIAKLKQDGVISTLEGKQPMSLK